MGLNPSYQIIVWLCSHFLPIYRVSWISWAEKDELKRMDCGLVLFQKMLRSQGFWSYPWTELNRCQKIVRRLEDPCKVLAVKMEIFWWWTSQGMMSRFQLSNFSNFFVFLLLPTRRSQCTCSLWFILCIWLFTIVFHHNQRKYFKEKMGKSPWDP